MKQKKSADASIAVFLVRSTFFLFLYFFCSHFCTYQSAEAAAAGAVDSSVGAEAGGGERIVVGLAPNHLKQHLNLNPASGEEQREDGESSQRNPAEQSEQNRRPAMKIVPSSSSLDRIKRSSSSGGAGDGVFTCPHCGFQGVPQPDGSLVRWKTDSVFGIMGKNFGVIAVEAVHWRKPIEIKGWDAVMRTAEKCFVEHKRKDS